MELTRKLVHVGPDQKEEAALLIEPLWEGVYSLGRTASRKDLGEATTIWKSLLEKAIEHGRGLNAKEFYFRSVENLDANDFIQALPALGFVKKHDRVEFRASLEDLADDDQSPIHWEPIEPVGITSLREAATLLHEASVGDPDYDPEVDPEALLKAYLADPELTSRPQCVHVGRVDGLLMAIVVAQIDPKSGWSRITHMGIIPAFRGRKLGKWVHRHGFEMMRDQGGKLYHGGTVSTNTAMIRLFNQHGCKKFRTMQEWIYRF